MRTDAVQSRPPRFKLAATVALLIAAGVVVAGLWARKSNAEQLLAAAGDRGQPTVALIAPQPLSSAGLELPARIEAWSRAPIYARVSGYLKRWNVDIGGKVKAGQQLAEIETPDLDQQLMQAKAELATARSNAALAASTAKRWQGLLASDSVSRQEVDERTGDMTAKQSQVAALQANLDRIEALKRFTQLTAPFDGVVTARNTDVGALINVGGAPGSELFVVSDTRKLRVYVNVPQRQVAQVRPGAKAELIVPERPGQRFAATVQSLSQSINTGTGAMLVQLMVDNDHDQLLPGGFATVRFTGADAAAQADAGVSLPPGAVIIGKDGVQVATVDGENRVRLRKVTIARDMGTRVELGAGLSAKDRVIENPPDGLSEGDVVRVAQPASSPAAAASAKGRS
ncbi:efflux RND transporter periplasmic adaptor subunit [Roseateles chitosanitabidus]|jgi:RND family efflux transporter MFP subunit|uniref:efflux RND transporter periplasmic adaptor subunit n=1 Tax=Roseateles chitosanitabidus TaxID=65048 RepID=UPI000831F8D8|nr:efflux RND transporter periplasmic adaptor subunit [Roseateles chitosanitabidus]MBO9689241.1 efflux RND transporter periplasmic adaptor subunit [Roseateles chitosanitabidus]